MQSNIEDFCINAFGKEGFGEGEWHCVDVTDLQDAIGKYELFQGSCYSKASGRTEESYSYYHCEFGANRPSTAKVSSSRAKICNSFWNCQDNFKGFLYPEMDRK